MTKFQYEVSKDPDKSTRFVVTSFEDAGPEWLLKLEHLKSSDKFKDIQADDILLSEVALKSKDKEQALVVRTVAEKVVVMGLSRLTEGLKPIKEGDILFTIARANASK